MPYSVLQVVEKPASYMLLPILLPNGAQTIGEKNLKPDLKISTVLQEYGLFPWKTVFENTILPLQLNPNSLTKKQTRYRIKDTNTS